MNITKNLQINGLISDSESHSKNIKIIGGFLLKNNYRITLVSYFVTMFVGAIYVIFYRCKMEKLMF